MSRQHLLTFFIGVTCAAMLMAARAANSSMDPSAAKSSSGPRAQYPATLSPAQGPADLVLTNAKIETMDPAQEWAGAVAIRGESIVAVSYIARDTEDKRETAAADPPDIKPWLGPNTRIINMHGAFVMPGFNDAHVHIGQSALTKLAIDFTGAQSLAEFQQRIRENIKDRAPGEWITGFGWDQTLWPGRRDPTRADLDAVSTTHPMFFARVDGHVAVANSLALKIAGVTRNTAQPPTGHIVLDAQTNEPTGLLQEDGATNLVFSQIAGPRGGRPPPRHRTVPSRCRAQWRHVASRLFLPGDQPRRFVQQGKFPDLSAAAPGREVDCAHHGVAGFHFASRHTRNAAQRVGFNRSVAQNRRAESFSRWLARLAHRRAFRPIFRCARRLRAAAHG